MKSRRTLGLVVAAIIIMFIPIISFIFFQISTTDNITVAIYNGPGVSENSDIILSHFSQWASVKYIIIDNDDIYEDILFDVDVLIMPGGDGVPYEEGLGALGRSKIIDYVEKGGGYIGICQGAYIACEYNIWLGIPGNSENNLGIFPGVACGPILEITDYPEPGWGMAALDIVNTTHAITNSTFKRMTMYYQGGCYLNLSDTTSVSVLAVYNATGKIAIATCEYGEGRVFITGPHPELEEDDDRDGVIYPDPEFGPYDPESDWPLLKNAVRWVANIL